MSELETATGVRQVSRETSGLASKRVAFESIPVIDLGAAFDTDHDKRLEVARQIRKASIEIGFFYIRNHGVSSNLIARVFTATREFFSMPLDEKMKIHVSRQAQHAGYIPLQGEQLQDYIDADLPDQKESLEVSAGLPTAGPVSGEKPPFVRDTEWLSAYPELWKVLKDYYHEMWEVAHLLYGLSALSLGLDEGFFRPMFNNPVTNIRLLHYPPVSGTAVPESRRQGCGAHSDYLCYTLLAQDDTGGLEVLNKDGVWIQAPYIDDTFVVNTGDLISHWTNNLFASTVHRVTLNQQPRSRYSIPFFTGPAFDAEIRCLPSCADAQHPPRYKPVTTGDYLVQRLSSTVRYEAKQ